MSFIDPRKSPTWILSMPLRNIPNLRENGRVLYVTFVNSANYVPQLIELTLK